MPIYVTDDNYDNIWNDNDSLKGYFVKLKGTILQIDTNDDQKYMQICIDNMCDEVFFTYYNSGTYYENDYVKVIGYILKSVQYTTQGGDEKENPLIMATDIEKIE